MKPVLVLGPAVAGLPPLQHQRLDLCRFAPAAEAVVAGAGYSSVIVLNDGGADAIHRLLLALAMRRHCKELEVGVLTYLDERALGDPLGTLCNAAMPLRIALGEEGLRLEYQAD